MTDDRRDPYVTMVEFALAVDRQRTHLAIADHRHDRVCTHGRVGSRSRPPKPYVSGGA